MTLANIRTDFLHWVAAGLGVIVALSACGGGDSSIDPAPVLPRLPLAADLHSTYLTFDAARDRIYASVLTVGGNRLVAINPPNGSQTVLIDAQADVPRQVHGPGTPAQIALSSAGTYLFIAAASGELIRYDFATQSVDLRLEPPLGVGPNLRVSRVVASPVDDERAFALLEPPDASSNPQAAAVATLVGSAWSPNVLDLGDRLPPPRVFEYSDDYGIWIRPDGTELIYGPGSASKRIRIDMGLPVSVT